MHVALPLETKAVTAARAVSDDISPRPPTRNQTMLNKAEPGESVETKDQEPLKMTKQNVSKALSMHLCTGSSEQGV
jgi:hypothetical protein